MLVKAISGGVGWLQRLSLGNNFITLKSKIENKKLDFLKQLLGGINVIE